MRVYSPAKINLFLHVGPIQTDGFHPLVSWMVTVGLFDTLDFELDTAGRVHLSCTDPALPVDDRNLIVRAARLLQAEPTKPLGGETSVPDAEAGQQGARRRQTDETKSVPRGVSVRLHKRIPTGSGLGGGSSNAATTLTALNELWDLRLPTQRLLEHAASLGSDVPFFLDGPSSICTGRGEVTSRVHPPAARWVVLLLPARSTPSGGGLGEVGLSMPTPAVYRQFDAMCSDPDPAPSARGSGWDEQANQIQATWIGRAQQSTLLAEELLPGLRNDLEPPAFALAPALGQLRQAAEALVARPVRLSGSGSSLFTLYNEREEAEQAAFIIQRNLKVPTIAVPIAPPGVPAPNEVSG